MNVGILNRFLRILRIKYCELEPNAISKEHIEVSIKILRTSLYVVCLISCIKIAIGHVLNYQMFPGYQHCLR